MSLSIAMPDGTRAYEGSPEFAAEIAEIVDACEADPSYENRVIEPLAGMFWPQVQSALRAERVRRGSGIDGGTA